MKKISFFIIMLASLMLKEAAAQWATSGNNIYNTNSGFVGIGNSSPSTLLYVAKNMTEPAITVQNLGGVGGATYRMVDDASDADWKFKTTIAGGFKIRDHAHSLDVITIEAGSANNVLFIKSGGRIGIGTSNPSASAVLDVTSSNKGILIPRMTSGQITVIQSPADGLMVYCTTDKHTYVYNTSTASWRRIPLETETINPCFNFTVTHTAGSVAPVTKTVTYNTVLTNIAIDNKCWITQNLGADHPASSATDATEASAGWYWQFNKQQGYKHTGSVRTPNTTWISSINENSDWTASNDPCSILLGSGWRLPTRWEWNSAMSSGWDNYYETYSSVLKIHAAGYLDYSNGSLLERGGLGFYYSSTQYDNTLSYFLGLTNTDCWIDKDLKSYGFTARCLKDL